jgi:cystathionine beta-lyase
MPHVPPSPLPAPSGDGFDELDEKWLRSRPGEKWALVGEGVLPCWVADMDFPAPAVARRALERLALVGDLGYSPGNEEARLEETWAQRMATKFAWAPRPGRIAVFSELVQAVQALLYTATAPGDGVMLFTPAYPPFVEAIPKMGRRLLAVPAVEAGGGWGFDLELASQLAHDARALLLVNPHNPTGRVLTREELGELAELAERHDLLVVSDEVHADLVLTGRPHVPFASLGPEVEARTVTLYSASKSHNLGGMRCALAHLGDKGALRALAGLPSHLVGRPSLAAVETTLAAWAPEGDEWLARCLERLGRNRAVLSGWLAAPGEGLGVKGHPPEATYLAWLDFREAGLGDDPASWLLAKARVMLSPGPPFGPGGHGFARLNFATTPGVLGEILGRVAAALSARA